MLPTTASNSVLTNAPLNSFLSLIETQILAPILTLLALGAFVIFVWGVTEYIRNAGNDEKRKQGQQHILWGLIGLVIIFGSTAIIAVIQSVVNLL